MLYWDQLKSETKKPRGETNTTTEKLSFKERLGYGLGTAGEQFPNFLVQTFLFAYFNLVVGLNAGVIATIMLIARVWDAVNDPLMGMIAEKSREVAEELAKRRS